MSEMTFPFRKIRMSIDDVRCGTAVPGRVEIIMKYSVALSFVCGAVVQDITWICVTMVDHVM